MGMFSSDIEDVISYIKKDKTEEAVALIKEKNINVNELVKGESLLEHAVYHSRVSMFNKLIDMGAKVEPEKLLKINLLSVDDDYTMLREDRYIRSGARSQEEVNDFFAKSVEITNKLIVDYNADKLIPKENSCEFLNLVVINCAAETVKLILERKEINGVDINGIDSNNKNILEKLAASSPEFENFMPNSIPVLIKNGAKPGPDTFTQFEDTNIQYKQSIIGRAIDHDLYHLVSALIKNGIKPTPEDLIDITKMDATNQHRFQEAYRENEKSKNDHSTGVFFATGNILLAALASGNSEEYQSPVLKEAITLAVASSDLLSNIKGQLSQPQQDFTKHYFKMVESENDNVPFTKVLTDLFRITKDERPDVLLSSDDFIKKQEISNKIGGMRDKVFNANPSLNNSKPHQP